MNQNDLQKYPLSLGTGVLLLIFAGLFFTMTLITSMLAAALTEVPVSQRSQYLLISSLQALLVFIIPSFVVARIQSRDTFKELTLRNPLSLMAVAGIIFIFILAQPFMNQVIYWNEHMSFPDSMGEFEKSIRAMEDSSAAVTETLLADTSVWGLVSGVLVIGVLTGFAEEVFFRGTLQRLLCGKLNHHLAIWITALIFSLMHFQFYGFVPRMILGGFFGYLFVWSRTLWSSVTAHALNNSIVVLMYWISARGHMNCDNEMVGVSENGFPMAALCSAIMVGILLFRCRKYFFYEMGSK